MMIKNLKTNRGFTLVELILAIGILSIIIVPISSMFINSIKTNNLADEKMKAVNASQILMENIKVLDDVSDDSINKVLNEVVNKYDNFKIELKLTEVERYKYEGNNESNGNNDADYDIIIDYYGSNQILITFGTIFTIEELTLNKPSTNKKLKLSFSKGNKAKKGNNKDTLEVSFPSQIKYTNPFLTEDKISILNLTNYKLNIIGNLSSIVEEKKEIIERNINELYRIEISIKKDNEVIQSLKGYKLINN